MAEGFSPEGISPEAFSPGPGGIFPEGFSPAHMASDFYKAIGVDRNASQAEIKKRCHALAKALHPDKTRTSSTEGMMKDLNKIKSVLLDEVEKQKYDEELLSKVEEYVPLFLRKNRATILLPPSKCNSY